MERAHWGFSNSNNAAAFWVLVALLIPLIFQKRNSFTRMAVISFIIAISIMVMMTASRAAMLAMIVAGLIFSIHSQRIKPLAFMLVLGIIAISLSPMGARTVAALGGDDASVNGRWPVYASVPAMIAAAPEGWGIGNAATAWHQWFEPVDSVENYRHLLSSHATWLVEFPVWGRFCYLFFWTVLLIFTLPRSISIWKGDAVSSSAKSPASFIFILAGGILGLFNHVFENPYVCAVFLAGVLMIVIRRFLSRYSFRKPCILAACITLFSMVMIYLLGCYNSQVSKTGGWVSIGNSNAPTTVVPWVDQAVAGKRFGHVVRAYSLAENRQIKVRLLNIAVPPPHVKNRDLLLIGNAPMELSGLYKNWPIRWVNPPAMRATDTKSTIRRLSENHPSVNITWGGWRQDASAAPWKKACRENESTAQFTIIPGTSTFVANPFLTGKL